MELTRPRPDTLSSEWKLDAVDALPVLARDSSGDCPTAGCDSAVSATPKRAAAMGFVYRNDDPAAGCDAIVAPNTATHADPQG